MSNFSLLQRKEQRIESRFSALLRGISLVLILSFFLQELSYANPDLKPLVWNKNENFLPWAKEALPVLPESVATIEDAYRAPGSNKTLILIQDAHTNTSGELNIAKALDLLFQKEPINYVFTEAGSGDESLSFLRQYASPKKREAVAGSFLLQGRLHGTEYLDVTSDHSFTLWGVEDMSLYAQSVETYRSVVKDRDRFADYLARIDATVRVLKSRIYNPFLLAFDAKVQKFHKDEMSFTDYYEALVQEAKSLKLDLSAYSHFKALGALKEKEAQVNFKKANEEALATVLSLSPEDQKALEASQSALNKFSLHENQVQKAFFALLEEKLGEKLTQYPELTKYLAYLKAAKELDPKSLLKEETLLEGLVLKTLTLNQDEEYLLAVSKHLEALQKLFKLTLTPDEFKEYLNDKESLSLTRLTGFLNKKLMDMKDHYDKALFLENGYEAMAASCERFYELTLERDQKFLKNLTQKMDEENQVKAILVTGGYHSPNLKRLFKEKNISYIVLTPQILHETNQKRYEKLLLGQDLSKLTLSPLVPSTSHIDILYARFGLDNVGARLAQDLGPEAEIAWNGRMKEGNLGSVPQKENRQDLSKGARLAENDESHPITEENVRQLFEIVRSIVTHKTKYANLSSTAEMNRLSEWLRQRIGSGRQPDFAIIAKTIKPKLYKILKINTDQILEREKARAQGKVLAFDTAGTRERVFVTFAVGRRVLSSKASGKWPDDYPTEAVLVKFYKKALNDDGTIKISVKGAFEMAVLECKDDFIRKLFGDESGRYSQRIVDQTYELVESYVRAKGARLATEKESLTLSASATKASADSSRSADAGARLVKGTRREFLKTLAAGTGMFVLQSNKIIAEKPKRKPNLLYYPGSDEPMLGEKPAVAYYPDTVNAKIKTLGYRQLLDEDEKGAGHARAIAKAGFGTIKIYLSSKDDLASLEEVSRKIFEKHGLRTVVVFSPQIMDLPLNSPALALKTKQFIEKLAVHPWIIVQLGNEDNYYLRGEKLGIQGGVVMTKAEYFQAYDALAASIKQGLRARNVKDKVIWLGHGVDPLSDGWEEDMQLIRKMKNIDGLMANLYLEQAFVYSAVIKAIRQKLNIPVAIGEFGWSRQNSSEETQRLVNSAIWNSIRESVRRGEAAGGVVFAWADKALGEEAPGSPEAFKAFDRKFGIGQGLRGAYFRDLKEFKRELGLNDLTDQNFWGAATQLAANPEQTKAFLKRFIEARRTAALAEAKEKEKKLAEAPNRQLTDKQILSYGNLNFVGAAYYYLAMQALANKDWKTLDDAVKNLSENFASAQMYYGPGNFWSPLETLYRYLKLYQGISQGDERNRLSRSVSKTAAALSKFSKNEVLYVKYSMDQKYGDAPRENWLTWYHKLNTSLLLDSRFTSVKVKIYPKPNLKPFKVAVIIRGPTGTYLKAFDVPGNAPQVLTLSSKDIRDSLGPDRANISITQIDIAEGAVSSEGPLNEDNSEKLAAPFAEFEVYRSTKKPSGARLAEMKVHQRTSTPVRQKVTGAPVLDRSGAQSGGARLAAGYENSLHFSSPQKNRIVAERLAIQENRFPGSHPAILQIIHEINGELDRLKNADDRSLRKYASGMLTQEERYRSQGYGYFSGWSFSTLTDILTKVSTWERRQNRISGLSVGQTNLVIDILAEAIANGLMDYRFPVEGNGVTTKGYFGNLSGARLATDANEPIIVTVMGLGARYEGDPKVSYRKVRKRFKLPNASGTAKRYTSQGIVFEKTVRMGKITWQFSPKYLGAVGQIIEANLKKPLPDVKEDEIVVTVEGLSSSFAGSNLYSETTIFKKLGIPNPKTTTENNITRNGVVYTKARIGLKPVWVFNKKSAEKFAVNLGANPTNGITEAGKGERLLTGNVLQELLVGSKVNLRDKVARLLKLPDATSYKGLEIIREGIKFRKRVFKGEFFWAFHINDLQKLAGVLKTRVNNELPPAIGKHQVGVTFKRFSAAFHGSNVENMTKFLKKYKLPNAKTFSDGAIILRGVRFEVVHSGGKIFWAFNKNDLKTVSDDIGVPYRQKQNKEMDELGSDEVRVNLPGLQAVFIGMFGHSNELKDLLPDPRTYKGNTITYQGVVFYMRILSKGHLGQRLSWAFKRKDIPKVAEMMGWIVRMDSDELLTRMDGLDLADAVALLGKDPLRFQQYLRLYHSDLSPEEVEHIASVSLKGLQGEWMEEAEIHSDYTERLEPPSIQQSVQSTQSHSFVLTGKAGKGTTHIQVVGAYTRKIIVRQDGTFEATISLPKTGEINKFIVYGFNPETQTKSKPLTITVRQTGKKEDIRDSFLRLLTLKEEILESIKREPARYQFLLRAVELSMLKYFTYDERQGLRMLRKKVLKEKSPAQKALLKAVLNKFIIISKMKFNLKKGQRLYFFQKYTIYETMLSKEKGAKGIIIANEQGLGKTITALEIASGQKAVILTPNSLVTTWAEQEAQFLPESNLAILEGSYPERMQELGSIKKPQIVTNIEFTRGMTEKRAQLLSRPYGMLIVDEADYLGNKASQQTRGTQQIKHAFSVLLTATPFKRISQIGHVLAFIYPNDPRFASARAFARAFPADDVEAMNALFYILQQHTIRIRKDDVFDTYDPTIPLNKQNHKLPKKVDVSPEKEGQFTLTDVQTESILQLFTNYEGWVRKHRGQESLEDKRYWQYKEGYFSKREAIRQIMNDPAYIGSPHVQSPKHLAMDRIVAKEIDAHPNQKMIIFTRYQAQVKEYQKRYARYGIRTYYGGLRSNADGYKIDSQNNVLYYKVDEYENYVLEKGKPVLSDKEHGRPIRALDYERILFQNDLESRIIVASYDVGGRGVTFTAGDVTVYDDLAPTYIDEYQAGDRNHRIDNLRQKYVVKRYWLQALYSEKFLRKLNPKTRSEYFDVGTYDQVHYANLRRQAKIFHRIMDGVGSEEELIAANQAFMKIRMPFLFKRSGVNEDKGITQTTQINGARLAKEHPSDEEDVLYGNFFHAVKNKIKGRYKVFSERLQKENVRWVVIGNPDFLRDWGEEAPRVYTRNEKDHIFNALTQGIVFKSGLVRKRLNDVLAASILSNPFQTEDVSTIIFLKEIVSSDGTPKFQVINRPDKNSVNMLLYPMIQGYMEENLYAGPLHYMWVPNVLSEEEKANQSVRTSLHGGSYSQATRVTNPDGSSYIEKTADPRKDDGKLLKEARMMEKAAATPRGKWFPKIYEIIDEPTRTLVRMEDIPGTSLTNIVQWTFYPYSLRTNLSAYFNDNKFPIPAARSPFRLALEIYRILTPDFYSQQMSPTPPDFLKRYHFDKLEKRWQEAASASPLLNRLLEAPYVRIGNIGGEKKLFPNLKSFKKMIEVFAAARSDLLSPPYLSDQHGDLHLGNILVNPFDYLLTDDLSSMRLIDPNVLEEGNDPLYDFAKLTHNLYGKYDLALNHSDTYHFDIRLPDKTSEPALLEEYFDDDASGTYALMASIDQFRSEFFEFLNSKQKPFDFEKDNYSWKIRLLFIEASIIAGLLPFHAVGDGAERKGSVIYASALEEFGTLFDILQSEGLLKSVPELDQHWSALQEASKHQDAQAYAEEIQKLEDYLNSGARLADSASEDKERAWDTMAKLGQRIKEAESAYQKGWFLYANYLRYKAAVQLNLVINAHFPTNVDGYITRMGHYVDRIDTLGNNIRGGLAAFENKWILPLMIASGLLTMPKIGNWSFLVSFSVFLTERIVRAGASFYYRYTDEERKSEDSSSTNGARLAQQLDPQKVENEYLPLLQDVKFRDVIWLLDSEGYVIFGPVRKARSLQEAIKRAKALDRAYSITIPTLLYGAAKLKVNELSFLDIEVVRTTIADYANPDDFAPKFEEMVIQPIRTAILTIKNSIYEIMVSNPSEGNILLENSEFRAIGGAAYLRSLGINEWMEDQDTRDILLSWESPSFTRDPIETMLKEADLVQFRTGAKPGARLAKGKKKEEQRPVLGSLRRNLENLAYQDWSLSRLARGMHRKFDKTFKDEVYRELQRLQKVILHEHASGLIFADDLLEVLLKYPQARRRFAMVHESKQSALDIQQQSVNPGLITQEDADRIFEQEIGPLGSRRGSASFNKSVRNLKRFTTYTDPKGDFEAFEKTFAYTKAILDFDPSLRYELVKKGLLRQFRENNLIYTEVTDYHGDQLEPLVEKIIEAEAESNGLLHVGVLKGFRKDHLDKLIKEEVGTYAKHYQPFGKMSLKDTEREILRLVTEFDTQQFNLSENQIRKEFEEARDEIYRQLERKGPVSEHAKKVRLILAYQARKNAFEEMKDFERQWNDLDKEHPTYARRIVGISSIGDEENYINWISSPILRRAHQIGIKVSSHVGERWYDGEYIAALQRIKREIEIGVDRLAHLTVLGLNFTKSKTLNQAEKKKAQKLQQEIFELIRRKNIHVETNPTSQIIFSPAYSEYKKHAARNFIKAGISFSINTDDSSVLDTDPTRELVEVWFNNPEISYSQLLMTVDEAWKHRFYEPVEEVVRRLENDVDTLRKVQSLKAALVVFGSARFVHPLAYLIGELIWEAYKGLFVPRTGAGPGNMKGPLEAFIKARTRELAPRFVRNEIRTQGIGITGLNRFEPLNPFVEINYEFSHFIFRKAGLYLNALGLIALPGGFGTLDEVFEVLRRRHPVALMDDDFWPKIMKAFDKAWEKAYLFDSILGSAPFTSSIEEAIGNMLINYNQHGYIAQLNEDDLSGMKEELGTGIGQLNEWRRPVVIDGNPSREDDQSSNAIRSIVSGLIQKDIPIRAVRRGNMLTNILTAAREGRRKSDLIQEVLLITDRRKPLTDEERSVRQRVVTHYDSIHQVLISYDAKAFVFFPGSYGTMNRLFDLVTAMQNGKIRRRPIVLVGDWFWGGIRKTLKEMMENHEPPLISPGDIELIQIADTPEEVYKILGIEEDGPRGDKAGLQISREEREQAIANKAGVLARHLLRLKLGSEAVRKAAESIQQTIKQGPLRVETIENLDQAIDATLGQADLKWPYPGILKNSKAEIRSLLKEITAIRHGARLAQSSKGDQLMWSYMEAYAAYLNIVKSWKKTNTKSIQTGRSDFEKITKSKFDDLSFARGKLAAAIATSIGHENISGMDTLGKENWRQRIHGLIAEYLDFHVYDKNLVNKINEAINADWIEAEALSVAIQSKMDEGAAFDPVSPKINPEKFLDMPKDQLLIRLVAIGILPPKPQTSKQPSVFNVKAFTGSDHFKRFKGVKVTVDNPENPTVIRLTGPVTELLEVLAGQIAKEYGYTQEPTTKSREVVLRRSGARLAFSDRHSRIIRNLVTGQISHQNGATLNNFLLPAGRFGRRDVNLVTTLLRASSEVLGYKPLISVTGSLTYIFKPDGTTDWDKVQDIDLRVRVDDQLSSATRRRIIGRFYEILNRELGDASVIFSGSKDYLKAGVKDRFSNIYPIDILFANYDQLFRQRRSIHAYKMTDFFFGNTKRLNEVMTKAGISTVEKNNLNYYLYLSKKIARNKSNPSTPNSKLLKALYQLAFFVGTNDEFAFLLNDFKKVAEEVASPASKKRFEEAYSLASSLIETDRETLSNLIARYSVAKGSKKLYATGLVSDAKPQILVFSGISGSGKTTLADLLLEKYPDRFITVPRVTNRPARPDDAKNLNHRFMTNREFMEELKKGKIRFFKILHGYKYGYHSDDLMAAIKSNKIWVIQSAYSGEIMRRFWPDAMIYKIAVVPVGDTNLKSEKRNQLLDFLRSRIQKRDPNITADELDSRTRGMLDDIVLMRQGADLIIQNPEGTDIRTIFAKLDRYIQQSVLTERTGARLAKSKTQALKERFDEAETRTRNLIFGQKIKDSRLFRRNGFDQIIKECADYKGVYRNTLIQLRTKLDKERLIYGYPLRSTLRSVKHNLEEIEKWNLSRTDKRHLESLIAQINDLFEIIEVVHETLDEIRQNPETRPEPLTVSRHLMRYAAQIAYGAKMLAEVAYPKQANLKNRLGEISGAIGHWRPGDSSEIISKDIHALNAVVPHTRISQNQEPMRAALLKDLSDLSVLLAMAPQDRGKQLTLFPFNQSGARLAGNGYELAPLPLIDSVEAVTGLLQHYREYEFSETLDPSNRSENLYVGIPLADDSRNLNDILQNKRVQAQPDRGWKALSDALVHQDATDWRTKPGLIFEIPKSIAPRFLASSQAVPLSITRRSWLVFFNKETQRFIFIQVTFPRKGLAIRRFFSQKKSFREKAVYAREMLNDSYEEIESILQTRQGVNPNSFDVEYISKPVINAWNQLDDLVRDLETQPLDSELTDKSFRDKYAYLIPEIKNPIFEASEKIAVDPSLSKEDENLLLRLHGPISRIKRTLSYLLQAVDVSEIRSFGNPLPELVNNTQTPDKNGEVYWNVNLERRINPNKVTVEFHHPKVNEDGDVLADQPWVFYPATLVKIHYKDHPSLQYKYKLPKGVNEYTLRAIAGGQEFEWLGYNIIVSEAGGPLSGARLAKQPGLSDRRATPLKNAADTLVMTGKTSNEGSSLVPPQVLVPKIIQNHFQEGSIKQEDAVTFLVNVAKAVSIREGDIMLGEARLHIIINHEILLIEGLSEKPIEIKNYHLAALDKIAKAQITLSMSELRQKLGLNDLDTKELLREARPLLSKTRERLWVDLGIFNAPELRPYLVSLLLAKLHEIHRNYKNISVILEGADVPDVLKEANTLYPNEKLFVTDLSQVPEEFKGPEVKDATLMPARSTTAHPGRRIYVDSLDKQSVLDLSRLIDVTIVAGIVDRDLAGSFFQNFIQSYETLLGRTIRAEELDEFIEVLEGRALELKRILPFAAKPHRIDIQYTLRVYELMIKMAQQAA